MLFTAHQFGPLFFFVVPAGLWLWKNRGRPEWQFEIARLSGLLGLIWFLTLSYVLRRSRSFGQLPGRIS